MSKGLKKHIVSGKKLTVQPAQKPFPQDLCELHLFFSKVNDFSGSQR